jgi:multiple sugar transport system substrate-binding protein
MDATEQTVTLDSPVGQSVIDFWRDMYADGLGLPMPNAQLAEAFLKGDVAMMFQSSSYSATLETSATFDVRSAPYPIPDGGKKKAVVGGAAVAMFSTSDANQQAEWQVIKEIVSARGVTNVVQASGYSPVNRVAASGDGYLASYLSQHPLAKAGWDQLEFLAPWYSFPGSHANEISQVLQDQINQAVTGKAPVDAALQRAADKARTLLQ